jgi:hypothetical protein
MIGRSLLDVIAERRTAELERLKRKAASGCSGAVAARQAMRALVHEELREATR